MTSTSRAFKSEKQLQTACLAFLKTLGNDIWYIKITNSGNQKKGTPDTLCCYKGRFIALEFKLGQGYGLTGAQELNIKQIKRAQGEAYEVKSLDDMYTIFGQKIP